MAQEFDLFARRMLHDVRNTLQEMTVGINKIKLHDHQKEHTGSVNIIKGAIVNVDLLLSRFHDLVRIRSYESHDSAVPVLKKIKALIGKRPIKFAYNLDYEENTVLCDEKLFKSFFNYLFTYLTDLAIIKVNKMTENGISLSIIDDKNIIKKFIIFNSNEQALLKSEDLKMVDLLAYLNLSFILKREEWSFDVKESQILMKIGQV